MAYPRAACPACKRNTAVAPVKRKLWRHDPASGRTEDLRSCPGSYSDWTPAPGEPGYRGDELKIFEI
jgi:hypothetical protein